MEAFLFGNIVVRYDSNATDTLYFRLVIKYYIMNNFTKSIYTLVMLMIAGVAYSQNIQKYSVDLNKIEENRLKVSLEVNSTTFSTFKDTAVFQFPKTIPGTYAVLDYGKYISSFTAQDANKKNLEVFKSGENNFLIVGKPKYVNYIVTDTYHTKVKKNKVFEPAGTNIQKNKNIIFNNSGFFGIFKGTENTAIELHVTKSENLYAVTSLANKGNSTEQFFTASSYHELVDNPIMFSEPDTTSFMVANCRVTIGVYNESGRKISKDIYKEIEMSMKALASFFDNKLPVNNYSFIIYLRDYTEFLPTIEGKEIGVFDIIKIVRKLKGQGFGALEHGNSSMYFLPDFGNDIAVKQLKEITTHEFLHILTPLNLHSECIGNFDYADPKMSKHLWLYEGITEYFAGLALTQGNVQSPWDYLNKTLVGKIKSAEKYPFTKMSFTEMSENVFVDPYKEEYGQVYERGALLGALLDIEVISLTNGQKTLKDVVMSLSKNYGKNKNFSESNFISEFVAASHPGIQTFFDKYITGKDTLAVAEILAKVGLEYKPEFKGMVPESPYKDVEFKKLTLGNKRPIKSVSKKNEWGFKKGDLVESSLVKKYAVTEYGYLADGEKYKIQVERDGKPMTIEITNKLKEGTIKHYLFRMKNVTAEQERNYKRWLKL